MYVFIFCSKVSIKQVFVPREQVLSPWKLGFCPRKPMFCKYLTSTFQRQIAQVGWLVGWSHHWFYLHIYTVYYTDIAASVSLVKSMPPSGVTPNLHFPHLHGTQIYTNPRFTRDPYLHSTDLHKSIFAHRFQETQIYTKSIFTQHNFTQNPNLQKTVSSNFASNYIKWIPLSTLVSSKKKMPL